MPHFDRLSSLIARFELRVTPTAIETANLVILANKGEDMLWRLVLKAHGKSPSIDTEKYAIALSANVAWGNDENPLFTALPETIERDVAQSDDLAMLIQLLVTEYEANRCGSAAVLNRLGEVLIVRIVREAIERGSTEPGVLAGLSDARLSRAIVAIHEEPGRNWSMEHLAEIAHMSRSRFAQVFKDTVGDTPLSYVRKWRMLLARQDLERGERVQQVARRYGYSSSEAFNRAIHKSFGVNPISLRQV